MVKGRHAEPETARFYRDLAFMLSGIVLVGAVIFGVLWLFSRGSPTVIATSSTTELLTSTTIIDNPTTTTTEPSTTATEPAIEARPPSEVQVVVLNASGVDGLAGRVSQQLANAGYNVLQPANYQPNQETSRIWYRGDYSAEAAVLIEMFPDAVAEPIPDPDLEPGADIVVVLGTSYQE